MKVNKWLRPNPPKAPIQCPWCDYKPMPPGKLSQHVHNQHPLEWKGNIYASLPADFNYGNGPLKPEDRQLLITYGKYAKQAYLRNKRKTAKLGRPRKSMSAVRRGTLGGLARAANARARVQIEQPKDVIDLNEVRELLRYVKAIREAIKFVNGRSA